MKPSISAPLEPLEGLLIFLRMHTRAHARTCVLRGKIGNPSNGSKPAESLEF
jgi:hypothetical protein